MERRTRTAWRTMSLALRGRNRRHGQAQWRIEKRRSRGRRPSFPSSEGRTASRRAGWVAALACLTILAYHVRPPMVPYGWASVDLFFVLSGYLITAILIRHEGSPGLLRNFYVRRGLRIWPVYYLTILALVILGPWLPWPTDWDGLGYYLTYTQNLPLYWSGQVPPFSPYIPHSLDARERGTVLYRLAAPGGDAGPARGGPARRWDWRWFR